MEALYFDRTMTIEQNFEWKHSKSMPICIEFSHSRMKDKSWGSDTYIHSRADNDSMEYGLDMKYFWCRFKNIRNVFNE